MVGSLGFPIVLAAVVRHGVMVIAGKDARVRLQFEQGAMFLLQQDICERPEQALRAQDSPHIECTRQSLVRLLDKMAQTFLFVGQSKAP